MHKYLASLVPVMERIEKNLGYKRIEVKQDSKTFKAVVFKNDYQPGYVAYFFEKKEYKEAPF